MSEEPRTVHLEGHADCHLRDHERIRELESALETAQRQLGESQQKIERLKLAVTDHNDRNHQRNVELDALHYVWCDGGCESGTHRFGDHPPLTPEIVAAAERNARRLHRWYVNASGKSLPGTVEARLPSWMQTEQAIHAAYVEQTERKLAELEAALGESRRKVEELEDRLNDIHIRNLERD